MEKFTDVLYRAGILNCDAPDIGDITGYDRDKTATYCQSFSCAGNSTKKDGVLVAIGGWVNICPQCKSFQYLTSRTVTPKIAARLEQELKERNANARCVC
jgi:hypothetical protein